MSDNDSINKIELESQILCTALRQSIATEDIEGAMVSTRELGQLFPDLLPAMDNEFGGSYYQKLDVPMPAPTSMVTARYFKAVRKALKDGAFEEHTRKYQEYQRILDAGFILRRTRLRISHDLLLSRHWLSQFKEIPEVAESPQPSTPIKLPLLIELLKIAQFIGEPEIQALTAQMTLAPEIPLPQLVLDSGYVSQKEMKSLELAQMLLEEGSITLSQFQVAIYDERYSGIRMAESLQVRGWLPVE